MIEVRRHGERHSAGCPGREQWRSPLACRALPASRLSRVCPLRMRDVPGVLSAEVDAQPVSDALLEGWLPARIRSRVDRTSPDFPGAIDALQDVIAEAILPAWSRKSPKVAEVLPLLYLHGLSPLNFAPALEQFLGSGSGFSSATVTKLTTQWQDEAKAFGNRDLSQVDFVYL